MLVEKAYYARHYARELCSDLTYYACIFRKSPIMLEIMLELCSIMPAKWRNKRNRHKNVDYCKGYLLNFRVKSVLFSLFAEYEKIDANYAEYTEYLQIMLELCQNYAGIMPLSKNGLLC